MKTKLWLVGWLLLVISALGILGGWVYKVDPYFHYHQPDTKKYFYALNNQRSQNDGISKHFNYDALITGTSMTENFKTSEMDSIFDVSSIKVSYSGGSYKEINDNIAGALSGNSNLKTIVRGLDMGMFFDQASRMREDLGTYPTYLYDNNPFNDVHYLFNKEVIFGRIYPMTVANDAENFSSGITSFDDYSRWQYSYTYGIDTVCPEGIEYETLGEGIHLTDAEKKIIAENISENVTKLADEYANIDFYYFFPPYSIVWWEELASNGTIYKQIEAEQYIIELILEHENIQLYSFNNRTDIIIDLNNYKDKWHYAQWINSMILQWMHDGNYKLTKENYQQYLDEEKLFYTTFDYNKLNNQIDYQSDFYAAALLNGELKGVVPLNLLDFAESELNLVNASLHEDAENGAHILECIGSLQRESGSEIPLDSYLINNEYIGAKIIVENIDDYGYLVFYGKKISDNGQPAVYVYDNDNLKIAEMTDNYNNLNEGWYQYVIDLTKFRGDLTIIFNGGYIDDTGSAESKYLFKDIMLY